MPVAADQCHAFGINRAGDADTVFHFVRNRPLHRPVFRRDPVNVLGSPADELLGALTLDEQWRAVACSGVQWRAVAGGIIIAAPDFFSGKDAGFHSPVVDGPRQCGHSAKLIPVRDAVAMHRNPNQLSRVTVG